MSYKRKTWIEKLQDNKKFPKILKFEDYKEKWFGLLTLSILKIHIL